MVRSLFRNSNNTRSRKNQQSNMLLAASNLTRPEYTLGQRSTGSSSEFSVSSPVKIFSRSSLRASSKSLPSAPLFLKKKVRFSDEAPKTTKTAANSKYTAACWYTASDIAIMAQQAAALCKQAASSNDDRNKVNRHYIMAIQDIYQTCCSIDDETLLLQDVDDDNDGAGTPVLSVLTDIEEQELQQGIAQSDLFGLEATACFAGLEVGNRKTRKAMKRDVREVQRALPTASCQELRHMTINLRLQPLSLPHRLFAWEIAKALRQVVLADQEENQA